MITRSPYALIVCGDSNRGAAILEELESQGLRAFWCATAREALVSPRPDVLIAELNLADHDGLELCEALASGAGSMVSILLCKTGSLDVYRRAMRIGIQDLCEHDADPVDIAQCVDQAVKDLREAGPKNEFHASVRSTAAACEQVQRNLSAWLLVRGIAPSTRCRIATAVGEALENVERHAYTDDIGPVDVHASLHDRDVEVSIRDRGEGMIDRARLQSDEASGRGGFARMCALSEDLSVTSHPNLGTHIGLRFSAHRTRFDEDERTDYEDFDFLVPDHVRALLGDIESDHDHGVVHLSPALAVTVGRLLAGPDPQRFQGVGI